MKKIIALAAAVAVAAPAGALEWTPLGARAVGMGGAGVALAQGPLASYWNPAALGRPTENAYGFQIPVTAHYGVTGSVVEGAKDLQHVQSVCSSNPADPACSDANIQNALSELNQPGDGVRIDAGAGADFKIGRLSFFANGLADVAGVPQIDDVHNTKATVANNTSALIVKGARIAEFGAGYGHELGFAPGVYLGADVKAMNVQVGYSRFVVVQNDGVNSNVFRTLKDTAKTSSNVGVDAGLLWDVQRSWEGAWFHPRFGLVGRNLNNPKFSQPDAAIADGAKDKYAVNPQARAGLSLSPFHWWNIAADLDLTRNLTPVDNVASRQLGVGTEVNVFNRSWINIPLRVGASRNLAETGSGTMISAGAGFNFLHLMVDVSGSVSPKRIQTQSQGESTKIPREAVGAVQLSFLFGGSEDSDRGAPEAASSAASQELAPSSAAAVRADAAKAQQALDAESAKH